MLSDVPPSVNEPLEHEILRPNKGLIMYFYPSHVVKSYNTPPDLITVVERDRRFYAELTAYHRFMDLCCPFVPQLLNSSEQNQSLSITRINGCDLFVATQTGIRLPIRSILKQLDQMDCWLRSNKFGDLENNIKDIILDISGKLYLIDFEPYRIDQTPQGFLGLKPDIYNAIVNDIVQRWFVRRGRSAKLTRSFVILSFALVMKRPLKFIFFTSRYLFFAIRTLSKKIRGNSDKSQSA